MIDPLFTQPALRGDRLVFVSDDDLWTVSPDGGRARRLTSGLTRSRRPILSNDGETLVFVADEEGTSDLYRMDADGGFADRRTWLGGKPLPLAFAPDDRSVVFASRVGFPQREQHLLRVPVDHGVHEPLGWGPGQGWAEAPDGRRALCRNSFDLAHWKRYRGGRVGRIWVDEGDGQFVELPSLGGNVASPCWIHIEGVLRLLFVSDHEGTANLFSTLPDGSDVRCHTDHDDRAVRFPVHDAGRVVYEHAGRLYRLDPADDTREVVPIELRAQHAHARPRHIASSKHLEDFDVHPAGHSLALTIRGRPFVGGHWEGPLQQLGVRDGVRHRLVRFLSDGRHLVWVSDEGGEEHLELCQLDTLAVLPIDLSESHGRLLSITPGPQGRIAIVDDAGRVGIIQLDDSDSDGLIRAATLRWLHEGGEREPPRPPTFSPDGRWLVWSEPVRRQRARLRLVDLDGEGPPVDLTDGTYNDFSPSFDPAGRWLGFLSYREFDPVPNRQAFGYSFPRGCRPYLVLLQDDTPSPFEPAPRPLGKSRPPGAPETFAIDLHGIAERVVRVPVAEARWSSLVCLPSGRLLIQREGLKGSLTAAWKSGGPPEAHAQLLLFDPATRDQSMVYRAMSRFKTDPNAKTAVVQVRGRLRVFLADADKATRTRLAKNEPFKPARSTGWVDLGRARLQLDPRAEWRQMLDEAWRMQRDDFWDPDLAGVDWDAIRTRYRAEVERVATRAELTDLIWCMQGELGTSHAYEMGGDHRNRVIRTVGRLGADFEHDGESWVVRRILRGDIGNPLRSSPLVAPGVRLVEGTRILAVDGRPVPPDRSVESFLVGHAGRPVRLDVQRPEEERTTVEVRVLPRDTDLRYRDWVNANRSRVHEATEGRAGYVHVPDMGPNGFAMFYRDYLSEIARGALVVDVRYNGGGHVSQLLLQQLAFRRLAFTQSRHFGRNPYPAHPVQGPMVALTNEYAGSDGDIFSHNWKVLGLGPLIGTRTWGGVVGLRPRRRLVDDTLVTQPEFAFWFDDVGYGVEGYGVEPDTTVQITPMDWSAGRDPQLEAGIASILEALATELAQPVDLGPAPKR